MDTGFRRNDEEGLEQLAQAKQCFKHKAGQICSAFFVLYENEK
jgi:hypothetical protein